jgi:hypothetical protein
MRGASQFKGNRRHSSGLTPMSFTGKQPYIPVPSGRGYKAFAQASRNEKRSDDSTRRKMQKA